MDRWTLALLAGLIAGCLASCSAQDVFSEEALVAWVGPEHLMVHLRFDQGSTASRLHTSFPHALQHLATTLPISSVELQLTSGRWRYDEWGAPLVPAKPVGAALDATFLPGLDEAARHGNWSALVAALSGLSCASLGQLTQPAGVARGRLRLQDLLPGAHAKAEGEGQRLHALLPREALCTENLTPWLRLLPCRDRAGLAALLAHRPTVFGSEYVSLGLLLERGTAGSGRAGVRLVQTATLVLRVRRPSASTAPASQARLHLEVAMGASVEHLCPPATRSLVFLAAHGEDETDGAAALGAGSCASPDGAAHGDGHCSSASVGAEAGGAGGARGGKGGAAPKGARVVPMTLAERRGHVEPPAIGVSRAMPRLQMYDTLDLLELKGFGLNLPLPPPPLEPLGAPPQPELPATAAAPDAAAARAAARAVQAAAAALGPLALGPAQVTVDRYVTGTGLLRGGMVLEVRRSDALRLRLLKAAGLAAADLDGDEEPPQSRVGGARDARAAERAVLQAAKQGGAKAVRLDQVVCMHQVFPWYVRPWLHSLVVQYDGKPEPLRSRLVAQSIRPAAQRASPGVLDVCLHVPPHVRSVVLQLAFTKAFLTAFEYPPDAHRGFDVPAAVVSYMDPLAAPEVQWRSAAAAANGGGGADGVMSSPLLVDLAGGAVQQLYTPGLLVPLAAPDFSMPYNVICLSSTLLAVYFGAGLNMLLGRKPSDAADPKRRRRPVLLKLLQLIVLVVVFGGLALHLDHDLRAQVEGWARGAGLALPTHPDVEVREWLAAGLEALAARLRAPQAPACPSGPC